MKYKELFSLLFIFLGSMVVYADDIRDVRSPVDFPTNYLPLLFIILIVIIIGIIFILKYFRGKWRKGGASFKKIKDPWDIALEEIEQLMHSSILKERKFNEYFDRLSDIIRRYFEGRFHIRAPEMTTEEFLGSLKVHQVLLREQEDIVQRFLTACDMVKFADHLPQSQEIEQCLDLAKTLIYQTKENKNLNPT